MSEQLVALRSFIDLLSPLHEAQERGLSERTIERTLPDSIDLEEYVDGLETEVVDLEAEIEAEQDQPSKKRPPL